MTLATVTFPPTSLGVYAVPLGAPGQLRPLTGAEALQGSGAQAVLNGAMFSYCSGAVHDYARTTCEQALYLARDTTHRALDVPTRKPDDGVTLAVEGGVVRAYRGGQAPAEAKVALQLYPSLVEDGRNVARAEVNTDNARRAAVAVLRDGSVMFAVGRGTMRAFAQELVDAGAAWAGYTDGGGSTRLQRADGTWSGDPENRRVPVWYTAEVPASRGPSGVSIAVWLTAGLLGVGLTGALMRKRKR